MHFGQSKKLPKGVAAVVSHVLKRYLESVCLSFVYLHFQKTIHHHGD